MMTSELKSVDRFLLKIRVHDLSTANCLLLPILAYPTKDKTKKKLLQYLDTVGVVHFCRSVSNLRTLFQ